ncbi:MAG: S8 family serine peptidase [Euryarchaeota archaeon]|nr:S8 family serine peptidase [Euryarchaeota archaeon]
MRWHGFVPAALVLAIVVASAPGLGQASGRISTGAAAGGKADNEGVEYHAGVTATHVYVDPVLVEAYEVHVNQVAILVIQAGAELQVYKRLDELGLRHHDFKSLAMASVLLPRDHLSEVAGIPGVLVVFRNEKMAPMLNVAANYVGAPVVWNTYGVSGAKGPTIMIVDSGIDGTHPDTKYGENLIQNVQSVPRGGDILGKNVEGVALTDFDGHGTHVASIAGGTAKSSSDPGKYKGIAHGAQLVGYAAGVLDPSSGDVSFESQTVLESFNYALEKQKVYRIGVVSNSWGANGEFEINSPINIATLQLYKKGLVVTFAAGNEGADGAHTLNKYSVAPWVLSVAAGDYLNQLARFSSRGTDPSESGLAYDHPDIMAPGVGITAAKGSGDSETVPRTVSPNTGGYTSKSGTSMATPMVSGAAQLLLTTNPELSPDNVMDILVATSTDIKADVWEGGAGYLNVLSAYQLAKKVSGDREQFLGGKVKYAGRESGDSKLANDPVSVGFGAGQAVQLQSGAQDLGEFAGALVSTTQGLVFVAGTAVLSVLAFGVGRRRY